MTRVFAGLAIVVLVVPLPAALFALDEVQTPDVVVIERELTGDVVELLE